MFGCDVSTTPSFGIPRDPVVRGRWLEFLHFEEAGINRTSCVCARHFTQECFSNHTQHSLGFATLLRLVPNAVPSVYTVGAAISKVC